MDDNGGKGWIVSRFMVVSIPKLSTDRSEHLLLEMCPNGMGYLAGVIRRGLVSLGPSPETATSLHCPRLSLAGNTLSQLELNFAMVNVTYDACELVPLCFAL